MKMSVQLPEDEEYAMAVRDFKKFFKRRGRFMSDVLWCRCLKKTRYAISGKVDTVYWAVFLGVRATFMDTAYVDSMDTPYWEVIKRRDNLGTTKRRPKEAEMTRTIKVIENALDAVIQIILLENVQNHRETRTKEHSSEVLGAIAMKKMMRRSKTRRFS
ncbi:hypothetical protein Tco_0057818 [Tanacetum coccineum]